MNNNKEKDLDDDIEDGEGFGQKKWGKRLLNAWTV